ASSGPSTLYFKGKQYEFVADRFTWTDRKDTRHTVDVPFFRVAGPRDRREGPLLATLAQVAVLPIAEFYKRLEQQFQQVHMHSEVWRLLFQLAEQSSTTGDRTQRHFYSILNLTAEAEVVLWRKQVIPYERVSLNTEGNCMTVRIKT